MRYKQLLWAGAVDLYWAHSCTCGQLTDCLELHNLECPSLLCGTWSLSSMLATLAASNSSRLPKEDES